MKTAQINKYKWRKINLAGESLTSQPKRDPFLVRVRSYIDRQRTTGDRFKWPGLVMTTQAFVITPLLSVIVIATGNWIPLWFFITASMYATFIPVLAGLSIRQVITAYFVNVLVSIVIVLIAVTHFLVV